ncbi:MAG: spermidine synthase [Nitrospirota bacterium]|nr:spermidine synthase [Nitrospirota bacterium]
MAQPWQNISQHETRDGVLELRRRGEKDFLILINGRVLMNSSANRSEIALGESACQMLASLQQPRVLIGGLGMGLTLRAALDVLPASAKVVVAELNPVVVSWCSGPLAPLTSDAVDDPRVFVVIDDVSAVIARAARSDGERFDAIVIDLYEGPHAKTDEQNDPFYGRRALGKVHDALAAAGVFAVWGEQPDAGFEKRLESAGFIIERQRPGRGGLRHVVYLARKKTE